eukprot:2171233-Rhodomonas_salina.2
MHPRDHLAVVQHPVGQYRTLCTASTTRDSTTASVRRSGRRLLGQHSRLVPGYLLPTGLVAAIGGDSEN